MATLRVSNATILTMASGESEPIRRGELVCHDGIITYVGTEGGASINACDDEIDANGGVLLPGLINAHTHLAMTLMRGYADDMLLKPWLEDKIWPTEANIISDDVYWGSMLGILEMLSAGITCYNDMYHFVDAGTKAAVDGGIRALPAGVMLQFVEQNNNVDRAVEWVLRAREETPDRIVPVLGPHAPYTCTAEMLDRTAEAALQYDIPVHIHLAETQSEVDQVESATGYRPVEYLLHTGLLEADVIAAHCVYLNPEELDILVDKQVGIVHCPTSNMKLASGFAPVPAMLKAGAKVGLGTDGAASNNRLDMLKEAQLAALIHKGYADDPTAVNAYEALYMATAGAAAALGQERSIGTLEVGKCADFVIVSLDGAHNQPLHNVYSQLIYAVMASDVVCTAVDGVILYHNGEYRHIDSAQVVARANESAHRLCNGA